jgi:hypothetical protein
MRDVFSHFLNDTGGLMAHNDREVPGPFSTEVVDITVADGSSGEANADFIVLRRVYCDLFDA